MAGQLGKKITVLVHPSGLAARSLAGHAGDLDALTIRRIQEHHATLLHRRHALQRVTPAKRNHIGHASALGVTARKVHHPKSHVAAVNQGCLAGLGTHHAGLRLIADSSPHMGLKGQVLLEGEAAQATRRDVAGDLRGLDHHRSAAATGVVEHGQIAITIGPAAGGQHGGGQGLFQRRVAGVFAPASFEKRLARGVDVQRATVGRQVGINAHVRVARIDIGAHTVGFVAEAVAHRVFDFQRGKVQRGQWAVLGRDFDLDALARGEPNLPGHLARSLVQVALVAVFGERQLHQHPLRQAAMQVQHLHSPPRTIDPHTAPALDHIGAR